MFETGSQPEGPWECRTWKNFKRQAASGPDLCYVAGMKLGVFVERDGVLNQIRVERQHQVSPLTLEEFHLNKEAIPLLKKLKSAGLFIIATTNQPGISRGYQIRRELDRMHELPYRTVPLDDLLVCPHDEADRYPCRKPKPGLLMEAGFKWHLTWIARS
jgi:D-glycero-D-manno-heptose 1,7-bisphosphate phosphatase